MVGELRSLLRIFRAKSCLPIHGCDEQHVRLKGPLRPLKEKSGDLNFSSWRLAHAVKKADCARWLNHPHLSLGATGFLIEHAHIFSWRGQNFRLNRGMSNFYADNSRTSLSGRIGQGMALLTLESLGYGYVGRFETLFSELASTNGRTPDFVVEGRNGDRALAEAKGRIISPGKSVNIKGALKDALVQLDNGAKVLAHPHNRFAIGTFLREIDDLHKEPSLIAHVTIPANVSSGWYGSEARKSSAEADIIRRANYAAWLFFMGLWGPARRVWYGEGERKRIRLPTIKLGRHTYALSVPGISFHSLGRKFAWQRLLSMSELWPLLNLRRARLEVVGLDLDVLKTLTSASTSKEREFQPEGLSPDRDATYVFSGGRFEGSIFSDGSIVGEVRARYVNREIIKWTEITL